MNNSSTNPAILLDVELIRLCLDDGTTYVTREGEIMSAAPKTAPKLDEIVQYVKALPLMTGKDIKVIQVTQEQVEVVIEIMSQTTSKNYEQNQDSELAKFFTSLCQAAVNASASDIHIEVNKESTRFLMRVDGKREVLKRLSNGQSALHQTRKIGVALASYIFSTLGKQDIKLRDPANDRFEILLETRDGHEKPFEWRVGLIPLNHGVKMTLRCVTSGTAALSLADMDLPAPYIDVLNSMIHKRGGAIVVSGPMGSGKSTLITALIELIDRIARCVHALEDPVEFEQEGVCKTTVEPKKEIKIGEGRYRDYAYYAVETLRHDVDVSALGEVREHAAAKEFCRKAETGGLAITTLHTNSAIGIPQTFIQQLNIPAAIVGAPGLMLMFVHQKLVRKLCQCALPLDEAHAIYEDMGLSSVFDSKRNQLNTLLKEKTSLARVINPNGCECCQGRGEKGRLVVMEIIVLNDLDRGFIAREDDHGWKLHLQQQGWPDIQAHTLSRIGRGQVDIASAAEQVDGLMPVNVNETYRAMQEAL